MIDHVIWDWNGTLLADTAACVQSLNVILQRRRMPPITLRAYREVFCFPVRDYYHRIGLTLDEQGWDRLTREYHASYRQLSKRSPLRRGTIRALRNLQGLRVAMSVLSASELSLLDSMIRERSIRGFFARVCGLPDLYAHSKVDLGRRLLRDSASHPDHTLIVGDSIHDYEVAVALGCQCVLLSGGHQSVRRLRQCGCPVLSDLRSLAAFIRDRR